MFYSDNILTRKGPLANIWLAAHWDRRLTKAQIVQTNIEISVHDIVNGALPPMALRLSGQLLLGVSKIYGRKARYLLEDCADALSRLKLAFTPSNVDLPAHASKASHATITLPTIANLDDALAPEPELDLEYFILGVSHCL
jgi:cohesin complex subunit SCC1